jgi:hypothetical protein
MIAAAGQLVAPNLKLQTSDLRAGIIAGEAMAEVKRLGLEN